MASRRLLHHPGDIIYQVSVVLAIQIPNGSRIEEEYALTKAQSAQRRGGSIIGNSVCACSRLTGQKRGAVLSVGEEQ